MNSNPAHTLCKEVDILLEQGEFTLAHEKLEQAIAISPRYAPSYSRLGYLYQACHNLSQAQLYYKTAIKYDPQNYRAYSNLAIIYFKLALESHSSQKSLLADAIKAAKKALKICPDYPEAHRLLAASYVLQGKIRRAVIEYEKIIECNPLDADSLAKYGVILSALEMLNLNPCFITKRQAPDILHYCAEGDFGKAVIVLEKAIALDPSDKDSLFNIGNIYEAKKHYDRAAEVYERTILLDPYDAGAHYRLGVVYRIQKKFRASREALQKAIEIEGTFFEPAYFGLGLTCMEEGYFDDSKKIFQALIEREPSQENQFSGPFVNDDHTRERALDLLVELYCYEKEYFLALSATRDFLKSRPQSSRAYDSMGLIYHVSGNFREAEKAFCKALHHNPKSWEAHFHLGILYSDQKRNDLSIKAYQSALKLNPKEPDIYNNLGVRFRVTAKYGRALKSYQKAIALRPDYYPAWWGMAIIYSDLKEYEEALDAFGKALEFSKNDLRVMHGLAECYLESNQPDKALQQIKIILDHDPDYAPAHLLLGKLHFCKGDFSEAITALEYAKQIDGQDSQTDLWFAIVYFMIADYEHADHALTMYMKCTKDDDLRLGQGLQALCRNDDLAAEDIFTGLIEDHPRVAFFHHCRAEARLKLGHSKAAIQDYKIARSAGGHWEEAQNEKMLYHLSEGLHGRLLQKISDDANAIRKCKVDHVEDIRLFWLKRSGLLEQ